MDVDLLSVNEVLSYIWEPGFTTVDKNKDESGRGYGLDAVKALVRSQGGSVEIRVLKSPKTKLGFINYEFIIKFPTTLIEFKPDYTYAKRAV